MHHASTPIRNGEEREEEDGGEGVPSRASLLGHALDGAARGGRERAVTRIRTEGPRGAQFAPFL